MKTVAGKLLLFRQGGRGELAEHLAELHGQRGETGIVELDRQIVWCLHVPFLRRHGLLVLGDGRNVIPQQEVAVPGTVALRTGPCKTGVLQKALLSR